jgi:hypothetical protein
MLAIPEGVMQPNAKPAFTIISEPLKGKEAKVSKKRLRAFLCEMAVHACETGLTDENVIALLK